MKKTEFDPKSLTNITSEMSSIFENLDKIIDNDENDTKSKNLFELEFEKFRLLLGKYMGKCLATVCEPFNESLYSASLKKCVEIGFLPEISDEFYEFLGKINPLSNPKNKISSDEISKFYSSNHEKMNLLYEHISNYIKN